MEKGEGGDGGKEGGRGKVASNSGLLVVLTGHSTLLRHWYDRPVMARRE